LKVANNTAKKYLETLTESDRQKVLDILSVDDKTLKVKFEELKENTISKLNNLINESDEELNKKLTETKDRIQKTDISRDEYVKLWKLNQNI
jgi:hypothetical protein